MKSKTAAGIISLFCILGSLTVQAQKSIYEIRVYKMKNAAQVEATDQFLKGAYLETLHRLGIKQVGVFKPISNDTAEIKQTIVIVPYVSLDVWRKTKTNLNADSLFMSEGKEFLNADTAHLPFTRIESTLLEAFPDQPKLIPTKLKNDPDAIYELRSYESPTRDLHMLKVDMFNAGGEIKLFKDLDFQAVFYGDVLSGSRMPNLVYMVVFANAESREKKWKAFGSSETWQTISADPKYRNNISVNHIDSWLLHRTYYSDL